MADSHELRDRIDRLESIDGDGTELVTLTVPPDKSMGSVRERIAREHAGAGNIRSDRTRDRVRRALERIQRELRRYGETPENGLAVYAGVVDDELVTAVFDELPEPVAESTYRCDDAFDVGVLRDAVAPGETFGLVVVERGRAAVGRLVGERVRPVRSFESQVMGSNRAGGQSAKRFERERARQKREFYGELGRVANDAFLDGDEPVTGLVVGGTMTTADEFVSGEYLDHRLRDRLLGTYSVEYGTVTGLEELVDAAESELLDAERREERAALDEFFERLRDGTTVAYGSAELEQAVEYGAVDTALVSASLPRDRREEIEASVSRQGGDVRVISMETDKGSQFAETFDGVGALLRFPVH